MPRFVIDCSKTAFLVIDMQNAFVEPGGPLERARSRGIVERLNAVADSCREAGIPVFFMRQAFRRDGSDMGIFREFVPMPPSRFALLEGNHDSEFYAGVSISGQDTIITKRSYNAFMGTDLDLVLRARGIDTLLLGGVDTAVCCESTARCARDMNYRVIFLSDGTATRDLPDRGWGRIGADDVQKIVLTLMAFAFAEVITVEDVIARIKESCVKKGQ